MQTTYRLNANEIDISFIEKLKELFKNKEVSIKIEEIVPQNHKKEIFKKLEELNKKYPPMIISPNINLSELANDVNLHVERIKT